MLNLSISKGTTAGVLVTLTTLGTGMAGTWLAGKSIYNLAKSALSFFPAMAEASASLPPTNLGSYSLVVAIKQALELLNLLPADTSLIIPGFQVTFAELMGNSTATTIENLPTTLASLAAIIAQLHVVECTVMAVGFFGTWTCMHQNTRRLQAEIDALKEDTMPLHINHHRP